MCVCGGEEGVAGPTCRQLFYVKQVDVRLDFRRSLGSGLRSSPKRDGWMRERPTLSVTCFNLCIRTGHRKCHQTPKADTRNEQ